MIGKVRRYDVKNELGYILGYDELTYFYHQNNVINNIILKEGDIVSFDFRFEKNQNELPYAINVEKEEINNGIKSYKELYEIIRCLPHEEQNKIPKSFINEIKNKMDRNYEFKVDHIKDFENQVILDETRSLLAIVYRDYLASEEEKQEIIKQEKEELLNIELEKQKKYNVDVFENKRKEIINNKIQEKQKLELTVKEKETWFSRFKKFLKNIFKK